MHFGMPTDISSSAHEKFESKLLGFQGNCGACTKHYQIKQKTPSACRCQIQPPILLVVMYQQSGNIFL